MQPAIDAEVRRTLAAYCQTVDDGRFDDFAQLWAPDAVLRVAGDEILGRAAIRAWIERAQPPERRGKHVTVNPLIDVEAADRARVSSDFVFLARTGGGYVVSVVGRYLDVLEPHGGRWVFRSRDIAM